MTAKELLIGFAAGYTTNYFMDRQTADFWAKKADEKSALLQQKYKEGLAKGMTDDEANKYAFDNIPAWAKYGASQLNGAAVAGAGTALYFATSNKTVKNIGAGLMAMGLWKFALSKYYPRQLGELTFDKLLGK